MPHDGGVAPWLCPACGRQFGRRNQSHECLPPVPLDDYLATLEPPLRAACEEVLGHLDSLGGVVVDAVGIGILVKRHRTFAEIRPLKGRMRLSFLLSRPLDHPRIIKSLPLSSRRHSHALDLRSPEDVDRDVREWLTEAFLQSPL
jgi:hypothetical protein